MDNDTADSVEETRWRAELWGPGDGGRLELQTTELYDSFVAAGDRVNEWDRTEWAEGDCLTTISEMVLTHIPKE